MVEVGARSHRRRGGRLRAAALTLGVAAVIAMTGLPSTAYAGPPAPDATTISGWMPYWGTAASLAAVTSQASHVRDVSPFWYALRKDRSARATSVFAHSLDAGTHHSVVSTLHASGVRVMPTITDETGRGYLASQLASPRLRAAVVRQLVATVAADGADGIDLDFEGFAFRDGRATWATLHPKWLAFIRELARSLARSGKALDVTMPPEDSSADSYWVYDEAGIAPYVHAIRLMAYDYHVDSPGALAPITWVRDVIDTATSKVPAGKVYIGVAAYGRSWVTGTSGSCPSGVDTTAAVVTPAEAAALASHARLTHTWDPTTAERTFSYRSTFTGGGSRGSATTCVVTRTVWYDDGAAMAARARLAASLHLGGIAVWSLDTVPTAAWPAIGAAVSGSPSATGSRVAGGARLARVAPRSITHMPGATGIRSAVSWAAPALVRVAAQQRALAAEPAASPTAGADLVGDTAPVTEPVASAPAAAVRPWTGAAWALVLLLAGAFVILGGVRLHTSRSTGRHAAAPRGRHSVSEG